MDLSRVAFPTFVLEPRSMLERITDFMAFPDLLFGSVLSPPFLSKVSLCSPVQKSATTRRSVSFASSSTISQAGTSNPRVSRNRASSFQRLIIVLQFRSYNPVLGEFFRCRYDYPDGSQGFYIAEQGKFSSLSFPPLTHPQRFSLPPSSCLRLFLLFPRELCLHPG